MPDTSGVFLEILDDDGIVEGTLADSEDGAIELYFVPDVVGTGLATPQYLEVYDGNIHIGETTTIAGLPLNVKNKTAAYTALSHDLVQVSTPSGDVVITLPDNPAVGDLVSTQKVDTTVGIVSVVASGGGTINGDPQMNLLGQWTGAVVEHKGSNVWIISAMMSPTSGPVGPAGSPGAAGAVGVAGAPAMTNFASTANWRPPFGMVNAGITGFTSGRMVLAPFVIPVPLTLNGLSCLVQTAGSADSTVETVLYADTGDFVPGTLKATSGAISSLTTGSKAALFSDVALPAGLYWGGVLTLGTTCCGLHAANLGGYTWWAVMGQGTGSLPNLAVGNDGLVAGYNPGIITSPPSTFAGTVYGDNNAPKKPVIISLKVRR